MAATGSCACPIRSPAPNVSCDACSPVMVAPPETLAYPAARVWRSPSPLPSPTTVLRAQTNCLYGVSSIQHHEAGFFADGQPVVGQVHNGGILVGDHVVAVGHICGAGHLGHMQAHIGDVQHLGIAERIPGVEHTILTPANADAVGQHFRSAGRPLCGNPSAGK